MSGGRATVGRKKGKTFANQAGDITAISPEGFALTTKFFLESKFYKNLDIESFCLTGKGTLAGFWRTIVKEAAYHELEPLLIARQNRTADLVITRPAALKPVLSITPNGMLLRVKHPEVGACELRYLSDVLECPFKVG